MIVVNLQNISLSYATHPLLDSVNLAIHSENKIALLGRNGTGKSSLMKIINGDQEVDSGQIIKDELVSTSLLAQEVPEHLKGSVYDVIAEGYTTHHDDAHDEQNRRQETEKILSLLEIDGSLESSTLSAGMKRRVLLGRALVNNPDLLLLDEPTNHLDLDAIEWLENFLKRYDKAVFFVTHDRRFLRNTANRIIELDRGKLFDYNCDYQTFLDRKDAFLEAEQQQNRAFEKKLAQEEEWIRRGIKARRTRNEGRVRALFKMREDRAARRDVQGGVSMEIQKGDTSGKRVIEAENVSFAYDEKTIVTDFSATVLRGDRIGIIGPNGCGKSTLIKLLLGELKPHKGKVKTGTNLEVVYFDQLRSKLDETKSVKDNVGEGNDLFDFNGGRKHVIGYLQDFLFTPDRAAQPVSSLSGGEKNRLLLAKLFTRPANFLVLDEPTNDLDLETVELLEELLLNYQGTLLLVSHDREFLNNVVTSTLGFTGNGIIEQNAGGYDEWKVRLKPLPAAKEKKQREKKTKEKTKLSFKEERELEELPLLIEEHENRIENIHQQLADPELYKTQPEKVTDLTAEVEKLKAKLEELYSRWDELEAMKERFAAR